MKNLLSPIPLGRPDTQATWRWKWLNGLAQLVSWYGFDKSSSEDEKLEEIHYKTDQYVKIKTKDLEDGDNFYDTNAEARWDVVCDWQKPYMYTDKFVGKTWYKNLNSECRKTFEVYYWNYLHTLLNYTYIDVAWSH